jgi:uncharacterized protein YaiI (UPF0178 family)
MQTSFLFLLMEGEKGLLHEKSGLFCKYSPGEATCFGDPMKILVDADACPRPVLQICIRLGRKYSIPVWTVASFNHNIESDHPIVVGDSFQEADIKIVNLTEAGDVVVTGDWGLAAMVLGKGAKCLSPIGREFRAEKMDFLLEERQLKAKFRRGGGRTKGPSKRTLEDDRRFETSLEKVFLRK